MKKRKFFQEKNLRDTFILSLVLILTFSVAFFLINHLIRQRCLKRMEEGVNTVIDEIVQKFTRDSRILNSTADILEDLDSFDEETLQDTMSTLSPLFETMEIRVLLPDNTIIEPNGSTEDGTGNISFEELAPYGEHVSNRMTSIIDGNTQILRHYVPIKKDGDTVAILYGVTILSRLPAAMNIHNIYNANASCYIVDRSTGDYIMDTWHNGDTLGNIHDFNEQYLRNNSNWTIDSILNGETGYVVFRSQSTGQWLYMYYAPANMNQNDWTIMVSVPEENAFANLFAVQRVFLITAIIIVIAICIYYIRIRKTAIAEIDKAVERAVLEEKLQKAEAAERAKTMFLSNMSHDIRTPMNAIIGFTTLAETNIDNKERVQEYLTKILSSSNHLLSLINDVLDMSRIESGRLNIEETECSISDIFRDMRNIILTQMQAKSLNFFMDTIDVVDEEIYCDKLHVNQVLLNLLSNAIKFTPPGGSVSLTIRQKPGAPKGYGAYEIRVKDTGIGMHPDFVKHIFEPFEREQTSTISGIQGTGLGMAITKNIVDTMGGTIDLETTQGKGTEFIINFEFRLQSESNQIDIVQELEGLHALVVDDSFTTCDSITKMLSKIGMRAEWTLHGKEAVLRAKQAIEIGDEFHSYIIDWLLPDLNGIEVARQIRNTVSETIPIIILTAYDWSEIEAEAKEAGVTAFCNKPLFLSELKNTLLSAIGVSNTEMEFSNTAIDNRTPIQGKRLLLVEDNDLNREIAEELLTENGFIIETAEDGSIAVNMVRDSEPGYYDLILMDVQMPIMNGYNATRAIRALENPELASIPIVAMTANAFEEDQRTAIESGMNAHIAKPIDVPKLMELLSSLLSHSPSNEM